MLKVPSNSFRVRISHLIWPTSFTTLWVLRHSQRDRKLHPYGAGLNVVTLDLNENSAWHDVANQNRQDKTE